MQRPDRQALYVLKLLNDCILSDVLDKVADRLVGPFNIEVLLRPINLKISEAIMNFQESSGDVSQRVFVGCGRPTLGRRRKRAKIYHRRGIKNMRIRGSEEQESGMENIVAKTVILDEMVKEIQQRIRDSRQFWLTLPYKLCNDGSGNPLDVTKKCWNGSNIDR
ncbi:hypothetical protein QAD02_021474 [Eretmocerus hayati]|uniref:Uncharacterized protein n=1 Tax=Eretmocerus hayati TaxID=131215 RepID=A0ACC2PRT9_9HYME|nr:hypothetical protein QAD02_021474 [Eretmocerus hayati]